MGSWPAWLDLTPLLQGRAQPRAGEDRHRAEPRPRSCCATARRGPPTPGSRRSPTAGRHWISVARADLAAMYFTTCIRGVVWQLKDLKPDTSPTRRSDFSEDTKIVTRQRLPVEGRAHQPRRRRRRQEPALQTQARIARARVTAYSARCPANDKVQEMSEGILNDLATLAAETT